MVVSKKNKTGGAKPKKLARRSTPRPKLQMAPSRPKVSVPRNVSKGFDAIKHYKAALLTPFADMAQGARLPGPYCFPTVTRRLKATFSVPVDGNGFLNAMVYPHPVTTMAAFNTTTAALSLTAPNAYLTYWTPSGQPGVANQLVTATVAGFANTTALANTVSTWRVVGGGIRIIPTGSFSTTTGIVTVAPVPLRGELVQPVSFASNTYMRYDSINTAFTVADFASVNQTPNLTTVAGGGASMAGLDALPDSQQYSFAKLLENGGIEANFMPVSACSTAFNATNLVNSSNTTGIVVGQDDGTSITISSGATTGNASVNVSGNISDGQTITSGRVDGWTGIAVYGTGLAAGQIVDIEVVMHVEGEPITVANSNGPSITPAGAITIYESGTAVAPVLSSQVETAIMAALDSAPVRLIGQTMRRAASKYAVKGLTALMAAM